MSWMCLYPKGFFSMYLSIHLPCSTHVFILAFSCIFYAYEVHRPKRVLQYALLSCFLGAMLVALIIPYFSDILGLIASLITSQVW